jgi:hypothetical protein
VEVGVTARRSSKASKDFAGRYFPLAADWFDRPEFRLLPPMAKNVFLAALMRFSGGNNGNISLPLSYLKSWSCTGNRQRSAALAELVNTGWLIRTRRGGLRMGPDLFALSVKPIDPCIDGKSGRSKHDVRAGPGLIHLWKPERAHLRELMQPKPRGDSKSATSIARVAKMRRNAIEDKSTTLRVSAEPALPELHVSTRKRQLCGTLHSV